MTHTIAFTGNLISRSISAIFDIVKDLYAAYRRKVNINKSIAELNRCTDKELSDMGISRGMIRAVVEGTNCD